MKLLTDAELKQRIESSNRIIFGVPEPKDWFSKDSPIQPSSVDLHIGEIFLPETKKDDPGYETTPLSEHSLEPGHTAVVTTQEEFVLPGNVAGIGFPPSHISFKGILMTNPGHIDAGYRGRL